jgi:hypothetical protein
VNEVRYSDPPPAPASRSKYEDVYAAARARPGRWVEFPGPVQGWKVAQRGFVFARRRVNGETRVWICYDAARDRERER